MDIVAQTRGRAMLDAGDDGRYLNLLSGVDVQPKASLNSMGPLVRVPRHFHTRDEFQLITKGTALFPEQIIRGLGVHYADAYTEYGPFASGEDGLDYIVMAPHNNSVSYGEGAEPRWGPEDRARLALIDAARPVAQSSFKMGRSAKQDPVLRGATPDGLHLYVEASAVPWDESRASEGVRTKRLLDVAHRGIRAEVVECKPGARVGFEPAPYGEFHVIVQGSCELHGELLEPLAVRYVEGEVSAALTAGNGGALLVITRFGRDNQ